MLEVMRRKVWMRTVFRKHLKVKIDSGGCCWKVIPYLQSNDREGMVAEGETNKKAELMLRVRATAVCKLLKKEGPLSLRGQLCLGLKLC